MAWNRNVKHFENIWSRTRSSQKLFSIHSNSLDRRYEMHFYHVGLWCLLDHSRYIYFNTKDFTWHFFYTSLYRLKTIMNKAVVFLYAIMILWLSIHTFPFKYGNGL